MTTWFSADDPLFSARFKLARANLHIKDFEDRFAKFAGKDPKPFQAIPEDDPRFPPATFRIVVRELPPPDWALIAGDAVTNLRASLDHLIYSLSGHWLRGVRPSNETAFVITDKLEAFHGRAREALSHLPDPVWAKVESFQPYHRVERPETGLLLALSAVVNADKHRTAQLVYSQGIIRISNGIEFRGDWMKDGQRIAIPEDALTGDNLNVQFLADVGLLMNEDGLNQMVGVAGLRQIHDFIRDEVIPGFAGFFRETPPSEPIIRPRQKRGRRSRRRRST